MYLKLRISCHFSFTEILYPFKNNSRKLFAFYCFFKYRRLAKNILLDFTRNVQLLLFIQ